MSLNLNRVSAAEGSGPSSSALRDSPILRGAYVHRRGENSEDERLVAGFWRASGLMVEALEDPSERFSRLPDFRLYRAGKPWAYCEVKTVWRHSWTIRILHEDGPAEEHVERSDAPVSERLSGDLVTALRQLRAGNPDHALFNLVVLVNRDEEASLPCLTRLFSRHPTRAQRGLKARRAAKLAAEVEDFRSHVDLCIWATGQADGRLGVEGYFLFNPELRNQVKEIAGLEPEKLVILKPAA